MLHIHCVAHVRAHRLLSISRILFSSRLHLLACFSSCLTNHYHIRSYVVSRRFSLSIFSLLLFLHLSHTQKHTYTYVKLGHSIRKALVRATHAIRIKSSSNIFEYISNKILNFFFIFSSLSLLSFSLRSICSYIPIGYQFYLTSSFDEIV